MDDELIKEARKRASSGLGFASTETAGLIRRLASRLEERGREGAWRPIDDEARDGREILAWFPVYESIALTSYDSDVDSWRVSDLTPSGWSDPGAPDDQPTLWQPLPAAPPEGASE